MTISYPPDERRMKAYSAGLWHFGRALPGTGFGPAIDGQHAAGATQAFSSLD
jgi:hypothetical protein